MTRGQGARRPGVARLLRGSLAAGCALTFLSLGGCAVGEQPEPQGSALPRADLAEQAEVAAHNSRTKPGGATQRSQGRAQGDGPRPAGGPVAAGSSPHAVGRDAGPSEGPGPGDPAASWSGVRAVLDPTGDHGRAPGYADLRALDLADDGTRLRIVVELASVVPGALAAGEVQGVGVDLFRSDPEESDYQVFLDGGAHGWRGFLQTPSGFVRFPGSLSVDGHTLTVLVPWQSLGGRSGADVSGFVDWADGRGATGTDTVERGPLLLG